MFLYLNLLDGNGAILTNNKLEKESNDDSAILNYHTFLFRKPI